MAHVLNKLTGVKFEAIKKQLEKDAPYHAEQGMHLEHLWKNADNPNEIYFLFTVENLDNHKNLMQEVHAEALKKNADLVLPEKVFLEE